MALPDEGSEFTMAASASRRFPATITLHCQPASVSAARRFACDALSGQSDELIEVVELLVSEVVTNAIVHARSPCLLKIAPSGADNVYVEVQDRGPVFERAGPGRPEDEASGRGLLIVDELAHRWGWEPMDGQGKRVWFHVSRPPPPPTRAPRPTPR